MKYLIIEDEQPAVRRLKKLIKEIVPDSEVVTVLDSIEDAVSWFKEFEHPELIFMDIQLADGLSFEIFNQVDIESSVIFTTAFDEYAVKAFRVNGLDYLLKPINPDELEQAIQKFQGTHQGSAPDYSELAKLLAKSRSSRFKERFLIKVGDQFKYIPVSAVAWFQSAGGITEIVTKEGKKWIIDPSLESLKELIDPTQFFQINRKMILHIDSISKINTWFNHRLKLELIPTVEEEVIVARDRVNGFKMWLDQ